MNTHQNSSFGAKLLQLFRSFLPLVYLVTALENEDDSKSLAFSFDKYVGDGDFEKSKRNARPYIVSTDLNKRDGDATFSLTNKKTFFSVFLDIGTPSQSLTVLLDTGSSDLWVIQNCGSSSCPQYGTFQPAKSSSFYNNQTEFYVTYGDNSYGSGSWGYDKVSINGQSVGKLSFGVATQSSSKIAVLGVGMTGLETTYSGKKVSSPYEYANLPMALKESGQIHTALFSLFLNDLTASTGSILFGAVDTSKFSGNLYTLPMVNIYAGSGFDNPVEYEVTLQGLGLSSSSSETTITTTKFAALLDSGTTLTILPTSLMDLVVDALKASYDSSVGYYEIECDSTSDQNMVFDFGGFHISVPLSDFVIDSSSGKCYLGFQGASQSFVILGDVFLSNAYAVFDIDNYEISLGQANYNGGSNVQEVSFGSAVPNAVKASGYYNTWTGYQDAVSGGNIFTLDSSTGIEKSSTVSTSTSFSSPSTATSSTTPSSPTVSSTRSTTPSSSTTSSTSTTFIPSSSSSATVSSTLLESTSIISPSFETPTSSTIPEITTTTEQDSTSKSVTTVSSLLGSTLTSSSSSSSSSFSSFSIESSVTLSSSSSNPLSTTILSANSSNTAHIQTSTAHSSTHSSATLSKDSSMAKSGSLSTKKSTSTSAVSSKTFEKPLTTSLSSASSTKSSAATDANSNSSTKKSKNAGNNLELPRWIVSSILIYLVQLFA